MFGLNKIWCLSKVFLVCQWTSSPSRSGYVVSDCKWNILFVFSPNSRNCGNVFCKDCCHLKLPIPDQQLYDPVLVCNTCHDLLLESRTREIRSQQLKKAIATASSWVELCNLSLRSCVQLFLGPMSQVSRCCDFGCRGRRERRVTLWEALFFNQRATVRLPA